MKKYFLLGFEDSSISAIAYTEGPPPISYELLPELQGKDKLPFDFVLRKAISLKNGLNIEENLIGIKNLWPDYLPNCLAWPLMSEPMKTLIEEALTEEDDISWIKAIIKNNSEQKTYYILKFNKKLDVLDINKTAFVPNTELIIKGYFSLQKIEQLSLFHLPNNLWEITSGIYINQKLKEALRKRGLTGLSFDAISEDRIV